MDILWSLQPLLEQPLLAKPDQRGSGFSSLAFSIFLRISNVMRWGRLTNGRRPILTWRAWPSPTACPGPSSGDPLYRRSPELQTTISPLWIAKGWSDHHEWFDHFYPCWKSRLREFQDAGFGKSTCFNSVWPSCTMHDFVAKHLLIKLLSNWLLQV